ncbi:MAG: gluconate 2-dehydrogenase subunit 3 family protein [Povalibacter sp.]
MNLDRRTAIQWMLAASAALRAPSIAFADDVAKTIAANGYGKDPNLIKSYASGELWPLTLTSDQRKIASALSDTIIPPEGNQPGAAGVGVVDFIDEWISAPYPDNVRDRPLILEGLAWLDERARAKYKTGFASSSDQQRASLCDELVGTTVPAALQKPAAFFARYRDLTAVGFYTTPIGTQDLGYRGNVPLDRYDGPPKEALAKLGLG